jgi:hypothetical protein
MEYRSPYTILEMPAMKIQWNCPQVPAGVSGEACLCKIIRCLNNHWTKIRWRLNDHSVTYSPLKPYAWRLHFYNRQNIIRNQTKHRSKPQSGSLGLANKQAPCQYLEADCKP